MRKLVHDTLHRSDYFFFIIIGVVFYIIVRQYIPYIDDYWYSFAYWEDANKRYPIQSLGDIIDSQFYDYFHWNGRVVIHSIVQFCCSSSLGREVHYLLSTASFMMLVSGMTVAVRKIHPNQSIDKYIILLGILLFFPCLGQTFLGLIAYTANYLWAGAAIVWLYNYYNVVKDQKAIIPFYKSLAIILVSFIIASLNESFTIPFGAALFVYSFIHYKKIKGAKAYLLLGFFAGACFLILAPSNFQRQESTSRSIIANCNEIVKTQVFIQFVLLNLGYLCVRGIRNFGRFIQKHIFFYTLTATSFLFAAVIAFKAERQLLVVEYFLLIVVTAYIAGWLKDKKNISLALPLITCCYALPLSVFIFNVKHDLKEAWNEMEISISNNQQGIAVANALPIFIKEHKHGFIHSQYIDTNIYPLALKLPNYNSTTFEYYTWQKQTAPTCILPDDPEIITSLSPQRFERLSSNIYYNPQKEYYVIRIENKDISLSSEPVITCKNDFSYTTYGKIKSLFGKTHQTTDRYTLDNLQHFHYENAIYAILYRGKSSKLTISD